MAKQLQLPIGVGSSLQFEPLHDVVEGARRYTGGRYQSPDPTLQVNPRVGTMIQGEYQTHQGSPPAEHTRRSYDAMAKETSDQYHFMTRSQAEGGLGIRHEVMKEDPYPSPQALREDVGTNRRIKTMSTATTGGHEYFSDEQNDQFRAVHDLFGHVATGRGFTRHGEEAAWQSHVQMYSPQAREAMTSETRGQNSFLNYGPTGDFPEQGPGSNLVGMSKLAQERNAGYIERGIPDRPLGPASNAVPQQFPGMHVPRIRR